MQIRLTNEQETRALGQWLGQRLSPGTVVGLDGELGTGKTWMTKGIVHGIGSYPEALVKSPAYNLIHEYPVSGHIQTVFHIDFYRLPSLSVSDAMLFGEIFERRDAICLVEWASRFLTELVSGYLSITLSLCGPTCRIATITTVGNPTLYTSLFDNIESYAHPDS